MVYVKEQKVQIFSDRLLYFSFFFFFFFFFFFSYIIDIEIKGTDHLVFMLFLFQFYILHFMTLTKEYL